MSDRDDRGIAGSESNGPEMRRLALAVGAAWVVPGLGHVLLGRVTRGLLFALLIWGAFGLGNPAHALGRAIHAFSLVADSLTLTGPRTSYNVGRIGGGTSINSIPFAAWMEVDMRSESPESLEHLAQAFEEAVAEGVEAESAIRREGPPLELTVDRIGNRPSGETDPS